MKKREITQQDIESAARLLAIWERKKKRLGLTQDEAAAQLGYDSQSTISQYLHAKIALNPPAILGFAQLLEVQPSEIDPEFTWLLVDRRRVASGDLILDTSAVIDVQARKDAEKLLSALVSGEIDAERFHLAIQLLLPDNG